MATKNFEVSDDNIIAAEMEDIGEEERQRYLVAEAHLKEQFLKGFRKGRGNTVSRVQDFVMPSFRMSNDKVEVITDVSATTSQVPPPQTSTSEPLVKSCDFLVTENASKIKELQNMFREKFLGMSSNPVFTENNGGVLYGMPPNFYAS